LFVTFAQVFHERKWNAGDQSSKSVLQLGGPSLQRVHDGRDHPSGAKDRRQRDCNLRDHPRGGGDVFHHERNCGHRLRRKQKYKVRTETRKKKRHRGVQLHFQQKDFVYVQSISKNLSIHYKKTEMDRAHFESGVQRHRRHSQEKCQR